MKISMKTFMDAAFVSLICMAQAALAAALIAGFSQCTAADQFYCHQKWFGRIKAALKSCLRYNAANAHGKLWHRMQFQVSKYAQPDVLKSAEGRWKCNLCSDSFDSRKALAVHARHKHQYRTRLKYFVLGDECLACGKKFFSTTRLLAHTNASQACREAYFACFVPAAEDEVEQIENEERDKARELRAQGWSSSKAFLPVTRVCGPLLPGSGTAGAASMQARWHICIPEAGCRFEGLDGFCEHSCEIQEEEVEILPFLLQEVSCREMQGYFNSLFLLRKQRDFTLPALYLSFFFSGFRRAGDLQHCIENHEIVGNHHVFCISVDLCLAKERSDLTDSDTKAFWISKMRQGHVLGIGGGTSCPRWPGRYSFLRCSLGTPRAHWQTMGTGGNWNEAYPILGGSSCGGSTTWTLRLPRTSSVSGLADEGETVFYLDATCSTYSGQIGVHTIVLL